MTMPRATGRIRRESDTDGHTCFSLFDSMPDELVLVVLGALDSLSALASWSLTSRRHHALANDPLLWRRLCESRFGPLVLHRRFVEAGKCWRWLYRAQSRAAAPTGADVGAVIVRTQGHDHVYWGDCLNGVPHGYGLALQLPTRHCQRSHSLSRVQTDCFRAGFWASSRAIPINTCGGVPPSAPRASLDLPGRGCDLPHRLKDGCGSGAPWTHGPVPPVPWALCVAPTAPTWASTIKRENMGHSCRSSQVAAGA
nr:Morn repeat [Pandoravirus massiliensis]